MSSQPSEHSAWRLRSDPNKPMPLNVNPFATHHLNLATPSNFAPLAQRPSLSFSHPQPHHQPHQNHLPPHHPHHQSSHHHTSHAEDPSPPSRSQPDHSPNSVRPPPPPPPPVSSHVANHNQDDPSPTALHAPHSHLTAHPLHPTTSSSHPSQSLIPPCPSPLSHTMTATHGPSAAPVGAPTVDTLYVSTTRHLPLSPSHMKKHDIGTPSGSPHPSRKKQFRFTVSNDVALLRLVLQCNPYAAPHGGRLHKWHTIANTLRANAIDIDFRRARDRTTLLLDQWRANDLQSIRRCGSGNQKEQALKERLLQQLLDLEQAAKPRDNNQWQTRDPNQNHSTKQPCSAAPASTKSSPQPHPISDSVAPDSTVQSATAPVSLDHHSSLKFPSMQPGSISHLPSLVGQESGVLTPTRGEAGDLHLVPGPAIGPSDTQNGEQPRMQSQKQSQQQERQQAKIDHEANSRQKEREQHEKQQECDRIHSQHQQSQEHQRQQCEQRQHQSQLQTHRMQPPEKLLKNNQGQRSVAQFSQSLFGSAVDGGDTISPGNTTGERQSPGLPSDLSAFRGDVQIGREPTRYDASNTGGLNESGAMQLIGSAASVPVESGVDDVSSIVKLRAHISRLDNEIVQLHAYIHRLEQRLNEESKLRQQWLELEKKRMEKDCEERKAEREERERLLQLVARQRIDPNLSDADNAD